MSTILERADAFQRKIRREKLSTTVEYWRGNIKIGDLVAQPALVDHEVEVGDIVIESRTVDFLIDRSEFPVNFIPAREDTILWLRPGNEFKDGFQVSGIGNEAAAVWHSRDGETWRIHTRDTGVRQLATTGHFGWHFTTEANGVGTGHFGWHFTSEPIGE